MLTEVIIQNKNYLLQWVHLNGIFLISGLLLSVGRPRNSLAEKEVIAAWILALEHLLKGNEQFFGYALTIAWFRIY